MLVGIPFSVRVSLVRIAFTNVDIFVLFTFYLLTIYKNQVVLGFKFIELNFNLLYTTFSLISK